MNLTPGGEHNSDSLLIFTTFSGGGPVFRPWRDVPINRYSIDTIPLMRIGVKLVREKLRQRPRPADSPFAEDPQVYFMNASLSEIADDEERESLMRIPTTLYLTDEQVDRWANGMSGIAHRQFGYRFRMGSTRSHLPSANSLIKDDNTAEWSSRHHAVER